MFPGMRGMNPKQLEKMLRAQGIEMAPLEATEVIIKLKDEALVIKGPEVTRMTVSGATTFQVVGKARTVPLSTLGGDLGAAPPKGTKARAPRYSEEDVALVMEQTGASDAQARAALQAHDGQPAEAIIALLG